MCKMQTADSDKDKMLAASKAEAETWKALYLAGTQLDPDRVGNFLRVTSSSSNQ